MKKYFLVFAVLFFTVGSVSAQLDRITIKGDYSLPLSERLAVKNSDALGALTKIDFDLGAGFKLAVNGGYEQYSFSQDSALAQWDWRYWDYYYEFVQTTLTEEEYTAVLSPVQKMDVLPLFVTLSYDIPVTETFLVNPSLGGGVMFFTRRFYVTEDWARDFDQINYTYSYSFRNIGPDKSGNPLFIHAGLSGEYEFKEDFFLICSVNYKHVINTAGDFGYSIFPFENALNFDIGIGFGY